MNIILGVLLVITGIVLLVVVGFGITLLLGITSKKQNVRTVGKFGLFISGGMVNFVTSPSESYSTFSDKFSDLDDKVSEACESL